MSDIQQHPPGLARRDAATTVALYATDPDPDVLRGMLAAAAAVAAGHGWTIVDDGTTGDDCLLTQAPQSRPGWDRLRGLAEQRRISLVVVPTFGHVAVQEALFGLPYRPGEPDGSAPVPVWDRRIPGPSSSRH
ncbi:hypothetical protein [Streptomyces gardneri]|uniref:hypothetical protein n=1 Tax=Streptomyces gardneri TaxID=66892 RepID=UPI0033D92E84